MKNKVKLFVSLFISVIISAWGVIPTLAQIEWQKHPQNPVLEKGPSGSWDDIGIDGGSIIFDGTIYHMWYNGYKQGDWGGIGHATSSDGINWSKDAVNPGFQPGPSGSFDDGSVANPCVIKVGDTYKMWYDGWGGGHLQVRIGYTTSTNGRLWTRHSSNAVLDHGESGSWNQVGVYSPVVVLNGNTYHMWYTGYDGNEWRIGYATSPDGITWTEHPDNPVMKGDSGWEFAFSLRAYSIWTGGVIFDGTRFHMFYSGAVGSGAKIGYATSDNGYTWNKDIHNPVLSEGPSGSWDNGGVRAGPVLFDGTTFHMWYSSNGIGYATSTLETSIDDEDSESAIPLAFTLHQNYPNPFNPETRISYDVAKQSHVRLRITNLQGQQVRTLVNEDNPVGCYEVTWDGKDDHGQRVASGVYLYRLESKDFIQTRKMILLQ